MSSTTAALLKLPSSATCTKYSSCLRFMVTGPGVDRFHETDQFGTRTRRPHPEERALARVSKDGGLHGRCLRPSFETHRLRDAPQDEVRHKSNFGATPLPSPAILLLPFDT